jgi:heme ABC exporter ATP-binding subunit CcmA
VAVGVEADGLMRAFGARRAVDGLDLRIAPGETVALLGPNGAGKTTLLRLVAGLLRPGAGRLAVAGRELPAEGHRVRPLVGYLGHEALLYTDLSPLQNLEFYAGLYGVDRSRIEPLLARVGLVSRAFDPVGTFSRGMVQRLALARMLLHEPRLLLLDEPYAGLDAQGAALLDAILAEGRGDRTVILVTHDLRRALAAADAVVVLRAGRAVAGDRVAALDAEGFVRGYHELIA